MNLERYTENQWLETVVIKVMDSANPGVYSSTNKKIADVDYVAILADGQFDEERDLSCRKSVLNGGLFALDRVVKYRALSISATDILE